MAMPRGRRASYRNTVTRFVRPRRVKSSTLAITRFAFHCGRAAGIPLSLPNGRARLTSSTANRHAANAAFRCTPAATTTTVISPDARLRRGARSRPARLRNLASFVRDALRTRRALSTRYASYARPATLRPRRRVRAPLRKTSRCRRRVTRRANATWIDAVARDRNTAQPPPTGGRIASSSPASSDSADSPMRPLRAMQIVPASSEARKNLAAATSTRRKRRRHRQPRS